VIVPAVPISSVAGTALASDRGHVDLLRVEIARLATHITNRLPCREKICDCCGGRGRLYPPSSQTQAKRKR
jgi:hypothetical protein